ncbi:MAG: hypothetical protein JWM95_3952 [Gemmatimonadetes bacterium]|nr:hypothetical protein [Gemmatimonadota bacterium]
MSMTRSMSTHRRGEKIASAVNRSALNDEDPHDSSAVDDIACKWPIVSLAEVVDINPRLGDVEPTSDSLASFVPMKSVEAESGRFEPTGTRQVSEVRKGYTAFRDGDVLFAKVTPCMENGKAAVMRGLTNGIGFGSTEFFALRPTERIDARYLLHFLLQQSFRSQAARNMTGAVGLRRVPKAYLERQQIPLPSLAEQKLIVAEIEQQFTRLDAGVAALRRAQANLKRYRAAVLNVACAGRLVPTEVEFAASGERASTFESGSVLLERLVSERRKDWDGRGKFEELAVANVSVLPSIPRGWVWATIDQIAIDTMIGLDRGRSHQSPGGESGAPYIKMNNVTMDGKVLLDSLVTVAATATETSRFAVLEGDILFNTRNSKELVGKVGLVRQPLSGYVYNNNLMRIRTARSVSPAFLAMQMCSPAFRQRMETVKKATTNVAAVYAKDLLPLPIALPPTREQARIVAEVDRRLSVVEELEATVTANLQRAARLRQSILQKAFSGTLV